MRSRIAVLAAALAALAVPALAWAGQRVAEACCCPGCPGV